MRGKLKVFYVVIEMTKTVYLFSQEKAYWRVYKPPPGYNTLVENPPVPLR